MTTQRRLDGMFGRISEIIEAQCRRALGEQAVAELVWQWLDDDERVTAPAAPRDDGGIPHAA